MVGLVPFLNFTNDTIDIFNMSMLHRRISCVFCKSIRLFGVDSVDS